MTHYINYSGGFLFIPIKAVKVSKVFGLRAGYGLVLRSTCERVDTFFAKDVAARDIEVL